MINGHAERQGGGERQPSRACHPHSASWFVRSRFRPTAGVGTYSLRLFLGDDEATAESDEGRHREDHSLSCRHQGLVACHVDPDGVGHSSD